MQMQQEPKNQPTVLLVEDNDDTRRVYSLTLRHAGFRVVEAPMCDGWEAARRIKADAQASLVPMLAFSALIDSIADLRREAMLFDGFIAKPVSPSELVRRVAAYVDLLAQPVTKQDGSSRPNRGWREPSGRESPAGTALQ